MLTFWIKFRKKVKQQQLPSQIVSGSGKKSKWEKKLKRNQCWFKEIPYKMTQTPNRSLFFCFLFYLVPIDSYRLNCRRTNKKKDIFSSVTAVNSRYICWKSKYLPITFSVFFFVFLLFSCVSSTNGLKILFCLHVL